MIGFKSKKVAKIFLFLLIVIFIPSNTYAESKQDTNTSSQEDKRHTQTISIHKEDFNFVVDGTTYQSSYQQQPFIYEGRTYVSLRFAGYILEKWIDWNPTQKAVTVSAPTDVQLAQLKAFKQQLIADILVAPKSKTNKTSQVNAYLNYGDILIDGKHTRIPDDVTTLLVEGTIFVPLRFLGEILQYKVDFDSQSRRIAINSGPSKSNTDTDVENGTHPADEGNGQELSSPGGQNSVTRESIVAKVESELNDLRDAYIAKGISLYEAYIGTSDQTEKAKLYAKGQRLFNELEVIVNEKLSQLDNELKANKFNVGTDSSDFKAEFETQKAIILSQLSNK